MTQLSSQTARAGALIDKDALRVAKPIIEAICASTGTPGLAIATFDGSGTILESYHGYRDVGKEQVPNAETVFNLGSMCKGFTALAAACLVADKQLQWDDPIDLFLESLKGTSNGKFTIRDLLSHRTGLSRSDALFIGSDNQLLLSKAQGLDIFASLNAAAAARSEFIYNNFGYHAVGCVIEKISTMNYGEFLAKRIFEPLNMTRTFTKLPALADQNVSRAYMPFQDLRLREVPTPRISDDTVAFAAGCIRSCVRDLSIFYRALLRSFDGFMTKSVFDDLERIIGDIPAIFEAIVPLHTPQILREHSYAMGWARTQLPNQMSELSGNSGLLPIFPTIGDVFHSPLLFHHGGNNVGCSSTVYLFPELGCGLVVLGNALGHCDATDWTAQLMTEACFFGGVKTHFLQYVKEAASYGRSAMERVQRMLDNEKKPGKPASSLDRYKGTYWHKTRKFCIVASTRKHDGQEELNMSLQGRDNEQYVLRHYYEDTFVFNQTFDEVVNRGQWCRPYWFYKVEFLIRRSQQDAIRWRIDDTEEQGQIFTKLD
ncbi:beta-lactamase/transpeptidase-like protein [Xylaria sp. FL0933]|nr:beta-lactamase/transpeptidase-like protein [Xylaria sp. FL0933]